jgi:hypothetical protein
MVLSRVPKIQLVSLMKPAIRTVISQATDGAKPAISQGTILGWNWRQTPAETHRKERERHHNCYNTSLFAAIVAHKSVYGKLHDDLVPRMR